MHFAKVHYKQVVYFNFLENPDYNDIFSGSLAVDHLIMLMSALFLMKQSLSLMKSKSVQKHVRL